MSFLEMFGGTLHAQDPADNVCVVSAPDVGLRGAGASVVVVGWAATVVVVTAVVLDVAVLDVVVVLDVVAVLDGGAGCASDGVAAAVVVVTATVTATASSKLVKYGMKMSPVPSG